VQSVVEPVKKSLGQAAADMAMMDHGEVVKEKRRIAARSQILNGAKNINSGWRTGFWQ